MSRTSEHPNLADAVAFADHRECSAYKEQFGHNFTSAIPTNVFGPHDNLYAIPLVVLPNFQTHRASLQRPRRFPCYSWPHPQMLPRQEYAQPLFTLHPLTHLTFQRTTPPSPSPAPESLSANSSSPGTSPSSSSGCSANTTTSSPSSSP